MKKVFWLPVLLFFVLVSCIKQKENLSEKPPHFYYKKSKTALSRDSLSFYLKEIERINKQHLSDSLKAEYAYMTSRYHYRLRNYNKAIENLKYATSFTKDSFKNSREISYYKALISTYLRGKNDFLNAAGVNEKLYQLLDKNDYSNLANVFYWKHKIKIGLNKPKEALPANQKVIDLFIQLKDTMNYTIATLDRAAIFSSLSDYTQAEKTLANVILYEKHLDLPTKNQLYSTQGFAFNQNNQFPKAIIAYKKALQFSKQLQTTSKKQRTANNYLNLSIANIGLKNYKTASKYLDSVFQLNIKSLGFQDQKEALKLKIELAYKLNKGVNDVTSHLDTLMLNLEEKQDERISNELEVLKESFKKEKSLQEEKNEIQISSLKFQRNQYILLFILLVVITIGVLILNFYRQRKFNIEKQNFLLQQRLLRSQMNPHFIFNSLSLIKQSVEKNKEQYSKYIIKLSRLLRTVFDNSTEDYVPLEDELQSLEDYIDLQQFRFPNRFTFKINNNITNTDELLIPPMLLQPFVENAIIHGFGKLETIGHLDVTISKENHLIKCIIDDNGVGMKSDEKKKQSSLHLIDQFLTKMTGQKVVIINKNNTLKETGVRVEFNVPYTKF